MENSRFKFRAWNTETNKMITNVKEMGIFALKSVYTIDEFLVIPTNEKYPLMQYTGLKDKNGVEIYEGDILHIIEDGNYGGEFYGKVEWLGIWAVYGIVLGTIKEIHKSFTDKNTTTIFTRGFLTRRYGSCIELSELIIDGLSYSKFSKREVIGNIYENKELLND